MSGKRGGEVCVIWRRDCSARQGWIAGHFAGWFGREKSDVAIAPVVAACHDWLTPAAIGMVACIAADMVHEALGHGLAALLTSDRILSISTVAVQNASAKRFVSAAGTLVNCFVGAIALVVFSRVHKLTSATHFLWIFAAFNLFNSGYLAVSALLNNGDWTNVIAGLAPPWAWRFLMGTTGAVLYALSVRLTAKCVVLLAEKQDSGVPDMQHLVLAAYLARGTVMTIASFFNPISPNLILLSGAGASFGLHAGLLLLPAMIDRNARRGSITNTRRYL